MSEKEFDRDEICRSLAIEVSMLQQMFVEPGQAARGRVVSTKKGRRGLPLSHCRVVVP